MYIDLYSQIGTLRKAYLLRLDLKKMLGLN